MKRFGTTCLLVCLALSTSAWADPLERAEALLEDREWQQALTALRGPLADPATKARALVLATYAHYELGDYKKAVEHGKRAVKALPDDSRAHLEYARALRIKMQSGGITKALFSVGTYKKEVQRALALDPDNVEAREEEIGFLIHAPGIAGGDTDKAREKLAAFKRLDWRRAMFLQAELNDAEEDPAAAIETFEAMVERDADDVQARLGLAYRLQRAERFPEADAHFTHLLDSDEPHRVFTAKYQLARSRILGKYEQEQAVELLQGYIETLDESIRGLPGRSAAYWRLGNAYEQLDRRTDARAAYEKALDLDADNEEAKKALKALGRG